MAGKPQLKFLKKVLHLVDNLPPEGPDEGGNGEVLMPFSPHQSAALTASPQGEAMALRAN